MHLKKRLLYRGVHAEFHERSLGVLRPKETSEFRKGPKWNVSHWGCTWSPSVANAVSEHQRHQAGYPTSGISTTPHIDRAKFYATRGGRYPRGIIYVIDEELCVLHGVSVYVVSDYVFHPCVPEDDEVILVAANSGDLPNGILVNTLTI